MPAPPPFQPEGGGSPRQVPEPPFRFKAKRALPVISSDTYRAVWELRKGRWYQATEVSGTWILVEDPAGQGWVAAAAVPRPGTPIKLLAPVLLPLAAFGFLLGGWAWERLVLAGPCARVPLRDVFNSNLWDPCVRAVTDTELLAWQSPVWGWGVGITAAALIFGLLLITLGPGVAREKEPSRGLVALWLTSVLATGLVTYFMFV